MKRLFHFLFLLLIFLLPAQLGRHFWPEWSLVNGVRVDYLAPTIYLTDVLILVLYLLNISRLLFKKPLELVCFWIFMTTLLLSVADLATFEKDQCIILRYSHGCVSPLSFWKFFKITEIAVFAWLVRLYVRNNKNNLPRLLTVLSFSMLFQSLLAILQFFNHGSLNGIFYWFGERNFSSVTPGIANAVLNGELILRPYGTFPHPNVLAGFLLIGIICVFHLRTTYHVLRTVTLILSSFALFLTLSRVAILLWVGVMLFCFIRRGRPPGRPACGQASLPRTAWCWGRPVPTKIILPLLMMTIVFIFLLPRFSSIFTEDRQSWQSRLSQSQIAISMWRDHPWFGVGLNQYLVELPKYMNASSFKDYQPVHNVFLLILSETGILGFLLFILAAYKLLHCFTPIPCGTGQVASLLRNKNSNIFLIFVVLILSLFDHYFYTLQQGNLMIGLIIGICAQKFY